MPFTPATKSCRPDVLGARVPLLRNLEARPGGASLRAPGYQQIRDAKSDLLCSPAPVLSTGCQSRTGISGSAGDEPKAHDLQG